MSDHRSGGREMRDQERVMDFEDERVLGGFERRWGWIKDGGFLLRFNTGIRPRVGEGKGEEGRARRRG